MKTPSLLRCSVSIAVVIVAAVANSARADISPEAMALAKAISAKLAPARTIQLKASHQIDPALSASTKLNQGALTITVKRPNQCYVLQPAGAETRELAYDGRTLSLIQPELKVHSLETLKAGTIEQFANAMNERFGFRPPVAELLASDLPGELFINATSAEVAGKEWVGFTRCERLHIEQDGLIGDIWVAIKDKLPRRMMLTFTGMKTQPRWDIRLTKWKLDASINETLFTKRAGPDSQLTPMVKSR
ncbi:MAG: DUF2092 domain-containing protein [Verrucomicrobiaceae bacterium]|nr:DUF2092 domain-containing protein [Verrucomicrobiaceae bacterium]